MPWTLRSEEYCSAWPRWSVSIDLDPLRRSISELHTENARLRLDNETLKRRLQVMERVLRVDGALARRVSELMAETFEYQARIIELEKLKQP